VSVFNIIWMSQLKIKSICSQFNITHPKPLNLSMVHLNQCNSTNDDFFAMFRKTTGWFNFGVPYAQWSMGSTILTRWWWLTVPFVAMPFQQPWHDPRDGENCLGDDPQMITQAILVVVLRSTNRYTFWASG
jgi:hypothetical protein